MLVSPLGRNKLINGGFDVWQRGAGPHTSSGYTADKWRIADAGGATKSITRETFTVGQVDVPGNPRYYLEDVVTTGGLSTSFSYLEQRIEGATTFSGQTVVLSFYAKADSSKNIAVEFATDFGSGGSPSTDLVGLLIEKVAVNSTWNRYTVTGTLPSLSGKVLGTNNDHYLSVFFWFDAGSDFNARTDTLGTQSGTFSIANVQLEAGSSPTEFEYLPIDDIETKCKRYYQRGTHFICEATGTTTVRGLLTLPVNMRSVPTVAASGSIILVTLSGGGNKTQSAAQVTLVPSYESGNSLLLTLANFSGLTTGERLVLHPSAATFLVEAEL